MIDLSNTSCFILPKELHVSQALEEPLLMDFLLLRAKCDGQMWLLKGLKVQYRDDFVYQELFHKEYNILSIVVSRFIVKV